MISPFAGISPFSRAHFVPAGGGFVPTDIAGCKLWLPATSISGVDGDPVSTWPDMSGNGNDATQGTAGFKPILKTGIINGLPVVRFDAVNDAMGTSLSVPRPYTIFLVAVQGAGGAAGTRMVDASGANSLISIRRSADTVYSTGDVRSSPYGADNAWQIVALRESAAIATVLIANGVDITDASPPSHDWGTIGFGAFAHAEPATGDIAECIVYDSYLGSTDLASVTNYLKTKYGL